MAKIMRFPDKEEYERYLKQDPATWEEMWDEIESVPEVARVEDCKIQMKRCPKCGGIQFLYMADIRGYFLFCIDCGYVIRPSEMRI